MDIPEPKPMGEYTFYVVCDPNWGEPIPLMSTLSDSEGTAIDKACMTDERGANIYSGAVLVRTPQIAGSWDSLKRYGYTVRKVQMTEVAA